MVGGDVVVDVVVVSILSEGESNDSFLKFRVTH